MYVRLNGWGERPMEHWPMPAVPLDSTNASFPGRRNSREHCSQTSRKWEIFCDPRGLSLCSSPFRWAASGGLQPSSLSWSIGQRCCSLPIVATHGFLLLVWRGSENELATLLKTWKKEGTFCWKGPFLSQVRRLFRLSRIIHGKAR